MIPRPTGSPGKDDMADDSSDDFTDETEFEEDLTAVDIDEEDLEDLVEEPEEPDEFDEDLVLDTDEDVVEADAVVAVVAPVTEEAGDEDEDEDEILNPDDVEADLDTILKDRLVTAADEEEEDEEEAEPDDRGEGGDRIQPRRPGEFVCQSCFLVKHPSQLADPTRMFCRDCV